MAGDEVLGRRGSGWRIAAWSAAGALLLVPLVAMRFTDEVKWTASDFVFAGALIGGTGLAFEFLARRSGSFAYRIASAIALAAMFMLVWFNAAVGVIGSEDNPANLMFAAVIAVAVIGTLVARFRPGGMSGAMAAAAAVQLAVGLIAVAGDMGSDGPIWPWDVTGLTGFVTLLGLASAGLFRMAAGGRPSAA
jgi:hypothetical protein